MDETLARYFPYFSEAKKRLFFLVSVFLVASVFGFFYYERIILLAVDLFRLEGVNIVFTSPFQFLELAINSALFVGIISIFPMLIAQLISFVRPALSKKEFRMIASMLPFSLMLFVIGFVFGVFVMRYMIVIFYEKSIELAIGNYLDVSRLLSQIMITSALMGLAFQFPIVLSILMRLKIVKKRDLVKQRLTAWAASLIFAAFLPPTDLLSLALLTLPLVILYEVTLLLNK